MGPANGSTPTQDLGGVSRLSRCYPCRKTDATSTGLNHWRAGCPETWHVRFGGGRWKSTGHKNGDSKSVCKRWESTIRTDNTIVRRQHTPFYDAYCWSGELHHFRPTSYGTVAPSDDTPCAFRRKVRTGSSRCMYPAVRRQRLGRAPRPQPLPSTACRYPLGGALIGRRAPG